MTLPFQVYSFTNFERKKIIARTYRLALSHCVNFWIREALVEYVMPLGDERCADIPDPVPSVQDPTQGVNTCSSHQAHSCQQVGYKPRQPTPRK